MIEIVKISC